MKISITQQKPIKFIVNQKDDNNNTFTGFVDSKINVPIFGCYKYKDIYIYKGEWKDDKKNGMGEMVFVPKDPSNINEELIHNSFLNFNKENLVVLFEDEAYRYDKIYDLNDTEKRDNILYYSGNRFTVGVKYVGGFKNNQMHGHGSLSYDNKLIYYGQWYKSTKHGKGISYNEQGNIVHKGEWLWNGKHGYGIEYFYTDGNEKVYERYEGEFYDGLRYNGKMYFKNGDTFDGDFNKGAMVYGVLETKEGGSYTGFVSYDDGYLTVKDCQQTTIHKRECLKTLQEGITSQQKAITPVSTMPSRRWSEKIFRINKLINNFTSNLQMAKQNTPINFKPIPQFRIKSIKNCRSNSEIAKPTFQVENVNSNLKIAKQNIQNNPSPLFKIKQQSGPIERGLNTALSLNTNLLNLTSKPTNDLFKKTLQISRSKIQSRNGSIDNKPIDIDNKSKIFSQKPPLNPKKRQNVGEGKGIINQSAGQNKINSRKGADTPKTFLWVEPPVNQNLPSISLTIGFNSNLVNSARGGWTRE